MVGKTDDNVVLDLETLMGEVRNIESGDEVRRVMCGSGTQHRNMQPLRSDKLHMTGKETVYQIMGLMQLFLKEIGASRGSKWRMIIILTFAAAFFISHHLKVGPLFDLI